MRALLVVVPDELVQDGPQAINRFTMHRLRRPFVAHRGTLLLLPGLGNSFRGYLFHEEGDITRSFAAAFARGPGPGLLQLGAGEVGTVLPSVLGYWREFGARYVTAIFAQPDVEERRGKIAAPALAVDERQEFAGAAPPLAGCIGAGEEGSG